MIRKHAKPAVAHKPPRRDKPEMTLDRVLSRSGIASRTDAARMIAAGRVSVDGRVVRDPQLWVSSERHRIQLDGQPLRRPRPLYWALHKPVGYVTSHGDPQGRPTVYDLLPPHSESGWVFPVGRLDQDTSGLLLVTNDSVFAERVANPELKLGKSYRVKVTPPLRPPQLETLRSGLDIGRGEHTQPARVEWLRGNQRFCWIELEIHEGKNRQVRRMIEALSHQVLQLVRVRIGGLELGDLPSGSVRSVRPSDVFGPRATANRRPSTRL